MKNWIDDAIFYHIYPLGFCGCEQYAQEQTTNRIKKVKEWIPHLKELHINALYLGPIFESFEHGYDTSDYRLLDRRLGSNADFRNVCDALHEEGIRIVLDGVFNHVGRNFWAFKDVQEKKEASPYCAWFHNLDFNCPSPMNDSFTYATWEGHYNLIKLNLQNEEVVQYLLESVGIWMDDFGIDGLRLDAADCVDQAFFKKLKQFCKSKRPDFWLMGEIIHGDYTRWANQEMLDSVTNYECYKGLYSAHNEKNYFEIAHSLNRQFAQGGIYQNLLLYSFVDNHDVNRLASVLKDHQDMENIYTMLFTMPGIPSIYYGSEFGITGSKHHGSDADIRPCLSLAEMKAKATRLPQHIAKLAQLHQLYPALQKGCFESVCIRNQQYVYKRQWEEQCIYIACNVSDQEEDIMLPWEGNAMDLLHDEVILCESQLLLKMKPKTSYVLMAIPYDHKGNDIIAETNNSSQEQVDTNSDNAMVTPSTSKSFLKQAAMSIDKETAGVNTIKEETKQETIPLEPAQKVIPKDEIALGLYEHYKGNHYVVLYIAQHSETMEKMVVYRQLYKDGAVWVRPLSMFKEMVEIDHQQVPRFRFIGK